MRRTGRTIANLALAGVAWLSTGATAQPVLTADQAVKMALERNSQIVSANASVLGARGSLFSAWSGVLPQSTAALRGSYAQTENQRGSQTLGQQEIPSATPRELGYATNPLNLSGSWSILDLSRISGILAAGSALQGARWHKLATRADVALATRQQFYQVVQGVKLIEVTTNAAKLARDSERRVRVLFEVGSVSRNDVLQAQVQTAQSQLDSIAAVQSLLVQRDLLASIIGLESSKLGEVDTTLSFAPQDYQEDGLLKEAAASRPDIKAAQARVKAAQQGVLSARLSWAPVVSLNASTAFGPVTRTQTLLASGSTLTTRTESDWQSSVSVALSWNYWLSDIWSRMALSASARAQLATAKDAYDVLQRNLAGEVHEAALTYQQVLASETVAEAAVASATESMKLTQQKYNVGSATILDLITTQVALERAQSQLVNALAAIRVAEARIDRVRGAGQ